MRRRTLLRAGAAVVSLPVAGCLDARPAGGPGPPIPAEETPTARDRATTGTDPAPAVEVRDFGVSATDTGDLGVTVTVGGTGDAEARVAELVVTVTVGEAEYERRRQVTPGAGTETVELVFDASKSAFERDGSLGLRVVPIGD